MGCSRPGAQQVLVADSTVVQVLMELHLLEARAQEAGDVSPARRDSVFAHYDVTEERFKETLAHYARQPEAFGQIYSRVLDGINMERMGASGL